MIPTEKEFEEIARNDEIKRLLGEARAMLDVAHGTITRATKDGAFSSEPGLI